MGVVILVVERTIQQSMQSIILDTYIKSKFLAEMSYEPTPKTIPKNRSRMQRQQNQ